MLRLLGGTLSLSAAFDSKLQEVGKFYRLRISYRYLSLLTTQDFFDQHPDVKLFICDEIYTNKI